MKSVPMRHAGLVLVLFISSVGATVASTSLTLDAKLGDAFTQRSLKGVFVAYEVSTDRWLTNDVERADRSYLPASTFKIPNSLIALECGAVADVDAVVKWDGKDRDNVGWNRDQNMREAFRTSTVWFYKELARRIGDDRMRSWVLKFEYGNREIGGGIDLFWLQGNLRITAVQQIEFLRRFRDEALPCRSRTITLVKEIMIADRREGWVLRAKTGTALRVEQPIAWYVGWVETVKGPIYFAMNFDVATLQETRPRLAVAYENLVRVGALPEGTLPAK